MMFSKTAHSVFWASMVWTMIPPSLTAISASSSQTQTQQQQKQQQQQQQLEDALALWTSHDISNYDMLVHRECSISSSAVSHNQWMEDHDQQQNMMDSSSSNHSNEKDDEEEQRTHVIEEGTETINIEAFVFKRAGCNQIDGMEHKEESDVITMRPLILEVKDEFLEEIIDTTTGNELTYEEHDGTELLQFYTVDYLFDVLQYVLYDLYDDIHLFHVEYDPTYGYPSSITIDPSFDQQGDEFILLVDKFAPLSLWQNELNTARAKWMKRQITSYQYTFRRYDSGSQEDGSSPPTNIHVVDGQVVSTTTVVEPELSVSYTDNSAVNARSSGSTGSERIESINGPTIESLFDEIQTAINENVQRLEVEYHWTYGYPTYVMIEPEAWLQTMASSLNSDDPPTMMMYTATLLVEDDDDDNDERNHDVEEQQVLESSNSDWSDATSLYPITTITAASFVISAMLMWSATNILRML